MRMQRIWLGALFACAIGASSAAASDLFVGTSGASGRDGSVLRYDGVTGAFKGVFVPPQSGGLVQVFTVLFGPDGKLYVFSTDSHVPNGQVSRFDGITGAFLGVFVPPGSGGLGAFSDDMTFGPDDDLYVVDSDHHAILRFDGRTGAPLGAFVTSPAGSWSPISLAFGPDQRLYVLDQSDRLVRRFDATSGAFVDVFITTQASGLENPFRLRFGPDGSLYVMDDVAATSPTGKLVRFDGRSGRRMQDYALTPPASYAFGPDGLLYVLANLDYSGVSRLDPLGIAVPSPFVAGGSGGLVNAADVTFGPCSPRGSTACLHLQRFRVKTTWQTPDHRSGLGQATQLTDDTADFWFFSPQSIEVFVKLVDGCTLNGHFWVFAGGLTNVQVGLAVNDTQTGAHKSYATPQGRAFQPIQDTVALPCP